MNQAVDVLTLRVLRKPHPQQRTRTAVQGGKPIRYTPKATRNAQATIRNAFLYTVEGRDWEPWEGPVELSIVVALAVPSSCPQWRAEAIEKEGWICPKHGDLDNYAKTVQDALNGLAYADDRQITALHARKVWVVGPAYTDIVLYLREGNPRTLKEYKELNAEKGEEE